MGQDATRKWKRWIDTFLEPPHDICDWSEAEAIEGMTYRVEPRSVAVLLLEMPQKRRTQKGRGEPLMMPEACSE
jgi:hypothetical protein